jgi:MFS-type transporter involved in bile tolerance (Atg22 family)
MWPGTYSLATKNIAFGGVRMFALLALAGDVGCVAGPSLVGFIADAFGNNLRISFAVSAIFPLAILLLIPFVLSYTKKIKAKNN